MAVDYCSCRHSVFDHAPPWLIRSCSKCDCPRYYGCVYGDCGHDPQAHGKPEPDPHCQNCDCPGPVVVQAIGWGVTTGPSSPVFLEMPPEETP